MNSSIKPGFTEHLPPPRWLTDSKGQRLAFTTCAAPRPWMHVLISHGFGEHRGWWHHVAKGLNQAGITAHVFDHFHHGLSDGRPADASYDELAGGLCLALREGVAPGKPAGMPLVLLGHSNGGLAVLLALRELPAGSVDGIVLSSPLLQLSGMGKLAAGIVARILSWVDPAIKMPLSRNPRSLTGNTQVWGELDRDPFRFRDISVRFYLAMLSCARRAYRDPYCQGLPLLLLCAGDEQVVDPSAMLRWFNRVESADKRRMVYPNLRHELFNEAEWRNILDDVVDWLAARFADRGGSGEAVRAL